MALPTKAPWRSYLAPFALAAITALGGFKVAFLPLFQDHQTRVTAQHRTIEYINPWAGIKVMQYPNDLVVYQQLIVDQEPDYIIETGTNFGGLTIYLSSVLSWVKPEAKILTVDIDGQYWRETLAKKQANPNIRKLFDRIEFFEDSSTSPDLLTKFEERIGKGKKVLVLLDSLHTKAHVLDELRLYGKLVHPGGYMIVTDTHINANDRIPGLLSSLDPWRPEGPLEAVKTFLAENKAFTQDRSVERYVVSANTSGWLRKKAN